MKQVRDIMHTWNGTDMRYVIMVKLWGSLVTIWNGTLDEWIDNGSCYSHCQVKDYEYDAGTVFIQITEIVRK